MPTAKRTVVLILVVVAGVLALGLAVYFHFDRQQIQPTPEPPAKYKIPQLRELAAREPQAATAAADAYVPKVTGRLDDLATPAEPLLAQLPCVVRVEVLVPAEQPMHRIVHVADWHYIPPDLYAQAMRNVAGRPVSEVVMAEANEELALEAELVQAEQLAALRCLIRHHGLRAIYCWGLTPQVMANYRVEIDALRDIEKMLPSLRQRKQEAEEQLKSMATAGWEGTDRYQVALAKRADLDVLLERHRPHKLRHGAPGCLLMGGEIEEVLPLDDAAAEEAAKRVMAGGEVQINHDRERDSQDAQVKAALGRPFALVVLGWEHDLSDSVRRLGGGRCEYVRVTTKWVREFGRGRIPLP